LPGERLRGAAEQNPQSARQQWTILPTKRRNKIIEIDLRQRAEWIQRD